MGDKMYVITRKDLEYGDQACQAIHSAFEFGNKYPDLTKNWIENSNYLVFLAVNSEQDFDKILKLAEEKEIKFHITRETDLENQITCIVLEPGEKSKKLCSSIGLALKTSEIKAKIKTEINGETQRYYKNWYENYYKSLNFWNKLKLLL